MEHFIEDIYDVLFHPAATMRRFAVESPAKESLAAFLISVLIPLGAFYLSFETDELRKIPAFIVPILAVGSVIAWFVKAAILHSITDFLGGHGTAKGLFITMGFSYLPLVLGVPFFVLATLFPGGITSVLSGMVTLICIFWMLVLDVAAIRGVHGVGNAKAVLVLFLPWIVIGATLFALVLFAGTAIISELMM